MRLEEIKKRWHKFLPLEDGMALISTKDFKWLVHQADKLNEVKELVNDERITKSETVDKVSAIVND